MNEITFGKNRYHLNGTMEAWCEEHIGSGGWTNSDAALWKIESMFGNTTFTFKHDRDATAFALRWA